MPYNKCSYRFFPPFQNGSQIKQTKEFSEQQGLASHFDSSFENSLPFETSEEQKICMYVNHLLLAPWQWLLVYCCPSFRDNMKTFSAFSYVQTRRSVNSLDFGNITAVTCPKSAADAWADRKQWKHPLLIGFPVPRWGWGIPHFLRLLPTSSQPSGWNPTPTVTFLVHFLFGAYFLFETCFLSMLWFVGKTL